MKTESIIDIKHLKTHLGDLWVHKDVNLEVKKGEILVIVGSSGSGKTVLLHEMLALRKPTGGSIQIFGHELTTANFATLLAIQRRWGVLFQQNALFSSLTVLENVSFPLKEHTQLDEKTIRELALLKIVMAGLPVDSAIKYPSELSGGMQKRAALARAIILDPELLFLDEPTAGLDPNKVVAFDELILTLQSTMGLTIVMVTHDVESLKRVANRVAFLGEGKVLCVGTPEELMQNTHPLIQDFFNGPKEKRNGH
jgi:phospholipid/cholesterol/gamma-HCH transport system ATP-binding protein